MAHLGMLGCMLNRNSSVKSLICDLYCAFNTQCKKDGHDPSELSPMSPMSPMSPVPMDQLFSWPGPKTLHLRRTSQGFGFTLRHFIVYPPESAVHSSFKDEDNGSRGRPRCRLEPMDTIFVKQVKEGGSAHQAGLCTGDRIVKVNGESIIGKTYSQVIALIQNSDTSLELCVMPKDEDILQLAYSKDAYLKGNEAYSGNAQNIPEPPPICYPRIEPKTSGMTHTDEPSAPSGAHGVLSQGAEPSSDVGCCVEVPITQLSPSPPRSHDSKLQTVACVYDESVRGAAAEVSDSLECSPHPYDTNSNHRLQETKKTPLCTSSLENLSSVRPRSQTTPCSSSARGTQLHYTPKRLSESPGFSTHFPIHTPFHPDSTSTPSSRHAMSPFTPSPPTVASSPCSPMHQNIDWRNYTTYKEYIDNKRLYTYGSRTIQERLDSLRAASQASNANTSTEGVNGSQPRQRSTCHERGPANSGVQSLCSVSQERLEVKERATSRDWHRSASQDALPSSTKSTYKPRARSCDYLGRQAESRVSLMDRRVYGRTETEEKALTCTGEETRGCRQSLSLGKVAQTQRTTVGGYGSFPGLNAKSKGTDPQILSSRVESLGNTAASKTRLPIQTSVLDGSYVAKALASLNTAAVTTKNQRTALVPNHMSPGRQTESHRDPIGSIPCPDQSKGQRTQQDGSVATNGSIVEGLEGAEATVVVVRREKTKKSGPLPLRHPSYIQAVNDGADRVEKITKTPKCWRSNDAVQDGYKQLLGEEYKPSGSGQLHESLDSIPFIDEPSSPSTDLDDPQFPVCTIVSAVPPSPTSSSAVFHRQLSHDQDSLRLTVLDSDSAAKTERSKSYDEGLDNYRDEERGKLITHIGLRGLRKTVDRSSEDSGSRRNSLSDVFVNATKEGVLHFRQFSSDKGKRVGGGMRPWKQMYAVLRGHSLYLYKDKKEGQTPNSHTEEEPLSISIKACLIDISYSDTKRKNVLRLTTSDCEYLFQAEDREDMLAWIRAIQENSNLDEENALITSTDLINRKIKEYNTLMSPPGSKNEPSPRSSRQSLSIRHTLLGGNKTPSPHSPHKEQERKILHRDEASPPKDKGLRRKGIPGLMRKPFEKKVAPGVTFGVRLDDCPPAHTNRFVPLIVEVCCKLVEERGLEYTGIYRVPGNNAAISSMQEELNRGVGEIDIQEDKWKDLNVISSLLKSFFRKLPDPLFTNEKYGDFIDANRTEDPVERLKILKRLLHELPDHHYETLKFLSAHLKTVAENSEKNKMEPRNLAIVFGPTLVRTSEDNMTHMVTHMPDQYKIVETLIQHYDWFFTDEGEEEPETVVQTESAVETQPVPNIDHLLTNIGRTGVSPGEVSDSPTSDSAKSKGSWGSGKDQYSRELVSSIFAAANRKRKKPKEKVHASSSDDDLDAVFLESELQNQKLIAGDSHGGKEHEKIPKGRKEHRNSFFLKKPSPTKISETQKYATLPSLRLRTPAPSKSSTPESPSQVEDLGIMNPGTSGSRNRLRIWDTVAPAATDLPPTGPVGGSAMAEVSSITSDYSTTSSMTFLTGAESSVLSADLQSRGGDEADDERSELISEGRHMETDSETEFPVFIRGATTPVTPSKIVPRSSECTNVQKPLNRYILPSQRLTAFNTLSKRLSLHQKTDSESSLEVGANREGERMSRSEPSRLSRVLEAVKKGRSVGSLSSASSSSHGQTEPTKRLSITERLKSHFRLSADDMFGIGGHKNSRKKEKRVRRRHTVGGQRDFGELAVINDWREQGGAEKGAELSDTDRLKLQTSREISIRDWITRERWHPGTSRAGSPGSKVMKGTGEGSSRPASVPSCQSTVDRLNGGEPKCKGKANLNSGSDAHPHKLSGAQVVRSQFYQCL
ncbi:rho GTPase-activating protein 21 isoform X2 [Pangasianodon hypophthalmus]|uniref:rho GTPase-activating protein 21 isoform X2 n=1 Tax=Pangasianodon hypophthalmus TaxID=310915 RepID=UPI0023078AF4|nr:rho GTPase-activating protein 21 isoform X2 [Pangasianodon hypophthalmus]